MAVLAIMRKVSRLLPSIIQVLILMAILHLISQGTLVRVKRSLKQLFSFSDENPLYQEEEHLNADHGKAARFIKHRKHVKHMPKVRRLYNSASILQQLSQSSAPPPSTTTPQPLPPMHDMEQDMEQRINIMNKTCNRWRLGLWDDGSKSEVGEESIRIHVPSNPRYQFLLVSQNLQISFCPVIKVGMNWMSKRLLELTGQYTSQQVKHLPRSPSEIARNQFPFLPSWEQYPVFLKQSTNILLVRHPFDRLLAYYKDSLENAMFNPREFIYYSRRIISKHRKKSNKKKEPTFKEFVNYLCDLDIVSFNEAWQPIAYKCTPCHIPYNVLGHYETLWNDFHYTLNHAQQKLNTTDYHVNEITKRDIQEYFSQLTINEILRLYNKYRLDFEIFGYEVDVYLSYAISGNEPYDEYLYAMLKKSKHNGDENNVVESNIQETLNNGVTNTDEEFVEENATEYPEENETEENETENPEENGED